MVIHLLFAIDEQIKDDAKPIGSSFYATVPNIMIQLNDNRKGPQW